LFPSRGISERCDDDSDHTMLFHMTGMIGTKRYTSPECGRGDRYNAKTDVYSFALIWYEVLTLQRPNSHPDPPEAVADRVCHQGERPSLANFSSCLRWPQTKTLPRDPPCERRKDCSRRNCPCCGRKTNPPATTPRRQKCSGDARFSYSKTPITLSQQ
jgi:serine/threonine protein kinase